MRKIKFSAVAISLATAVSFLITGCGSNATQTQETTPAPTEAKGEKVEGKYGENVLLGPYTGLTVDVTKLVVTDKDVEDQKEMLIEQSITYEEIKEGTVKDEDTICLDYTGKLDGKEFEGGKATDYIYTVSKANPSFIQDLNDQLIGLEVGKSYDLNVKFPDNYGNADLKGKDTVFTVVVKYIRGKEIVPEWNDEFCNKISNGAQKTTAEAEKFIRDNLEKNAENTMDTDYAAGIISQLYKESTILKYPEDKLSSEESLIYDSYRNNYTNTAQMYGFSYEEFLQAAYGCTDEDVKSQAKEEAKASVAYAMLLVSIAEKENISISDEEYKDALDTAYKNYSFASAEEFEKKYGKEYFHEFVLTQKVLDWLKEKNTKNLVEKETEPITAPETSAQ